jgi:uncharacterized protein with GYD domain
MPKYAMFMKLTAQGRGELDDVVRYMNLHKEAWELIGGKADVYLMTGDYDFLVVASAEDELAVKALLLEIAKQGDVTTSTSSLSDTGDLKTLTVLPKGAYHKFTPPASEK